MMVVKINSENVDWMVKIIAQKTGIHARWECRMSWRDGGFAMLLATQNKESGNDTRRSEDTR